MTGGRTYLHEGDKLVLKERATEVVVTRRSHVGRRRLVVLDQRVQRFELTADKHWRGGAPGRTYRYRNPLYFVSFIFHFGQNSAVISGTGR